jgi:cellobiose epimerase
LGLTGDVRTLAIAKNMLDHALQHGWDENTGGFFDGGYYFKGDEHCTIVRNAKIWWAQAEGLNSLLLFAKIFPGEPRYYEYFLRQWEYIKSFVIDNEGGDWFEGGVDKEPQSRTGPKSHMWKCTYHTCRALMNCITILEDDPEKGLNRLIGSWQKISAPVLNTKTADTFNLYAAG